MEPLEVLNVRLIDYFGVAWNGFPIYRIVWSEDQFEKRLTDCTDTGVILLVPEVRELPKYKQWIHNKFILEKLIAVPEVNAKELENKVSYEPLFVFEDINGNPLPPKWEAAKFVIDTVNAAMGESSLKAKYVDPDIKSPQENRNKRIQKLQDDLFGNESNVGDALAHKQAVTVLTDHNSAKES